MKKKTQLILIIIILSIFYLPFIFYFSINNVISKAFEDVIEQEKGIIRYSTKLCIHITSRSFTECKNFIRNNRQQLYHGIFPKQYSFKCNLAKNDNSTGCENNSENIDCILFDENMYYVDLPKKKLLSFSYAEDDCDWIFQADDDMTLIQPIIDLLNRKEIQDCYFSGALCYFGRVHVKIKMEPVGHTFHDPYFIQQFGHDILPPYMCGGFFGYSGEVGELFKILAKNDFYNMKGNSDVYFGLIFLSINATFVPTGWTFEHTNNYWKTLEGS